MVNERPDQLVLEERPCRYGVESFNSFIVVYFVPFTQFNIEIKTSKGLKCFPKTSPINTWRSSYDNSTFKDYFLLSQYTLGQFLVAERAAGPLIISEIVMDFSESRKEHEIRSAFDNPGMNASSADKAPPLKDCSEVYRVGATSPGWYELDTTGSMSNADHDEVYCEDGWTHILRRNPKEARYAYVSHCEP